MELSKIKRIRSDELKKFMDLLAWVARRVKHNGRDMSIHEFLYNEPFNVFNYLKVRTIPGILAVELDFTSMPQKENGPKTTKCTTTLPRSCQLWLIPCFLLTLRKNPSLGTLWVVMEHLFAI